MPLSLAHLIFTDQYSPVGFGGQFGYYRDYTGFYLLGHRYYDPKQGRFLTRDPIGYGGGINLYGFCGNNPVNRQDPNGTADTPTDPNAYFNNLFSYATPHDVFHALAHNDATRAVKTLVNIYSNFVFPEAEASVAVVRGAEGIANVLPRTLARVVPTDVVSNTLGRPGARDVFVTAAEDIRGLSAKEIAERLAIPKSSSFKVIEFPTKSVRGLASPIQRANPGFIGRGRTAGGAREFVIENGPIPKGAKIRVVGY